MSSYVKKFWEIGDIITAEALNNIEKGIAELDIAVNAANPSMEIGVEYRTKEKHKGKAVYVKLIDFGGLPNTSLKCVETGISGAFAFDMKWSIYSKDNQLVHFPLIGSDYAAKTRATLEPDGKLYFRTCTNLSEYKAIVTIKYTKK